MGPETTDYRAIHVGSQNATDPRTAIYPWLAWRMSGCFSGGKQLSTGRVPSTFDPSIACRRCATRQASSALDLFDALDVLEVGSLDLEGKHSGR